MQISITAEKSLINSLEAAITHDPKMQVQRVEDAKDETELAFGIGEVLTLVTIAKGITDLVQVLLSIKNKLGPRKQTIYITTALGRMAVEISKDITAKELYEQVGEIVPDR